MIRIIKRIIKALIFLTPMKKRFFHQYIYNFRPNQLSFFIKCIDDIADIPGSIVEIGVDRGATTVYLNKHLDAIGLEKEYIGIDLFSKQYGFTKHDIDYEIENRDKKKSYYKNHMGATLKDIKYTLYINKIERVKLIKADISKYDFDSNTKVALCLLDVDLYLPTLNALRKCYPLLQPGGIIIVDDCQDKKYWDGALQAYMEFTKEMSIKPSIVLDKLGIIKKS